MKRTESEIKTGLELALEEILRVDTLNEWISCSDRPIGKILSEVGRIDKKYALCAMKALAECGLVEEEGTGPTKRYRVLSTVIPDIKFLVNKIRKDTVELSRIHQDRYKAKVHAAMEMAKKREFKMEEKKPEPAPRSNVAKKSPEPESTLFSKVSSEICLGDMKYIIYDNQIFECRVVSMSLNAEDEVRYGVICSLFRPYEQGGSYFPFVKDGLNKEDIFRTVEDAVKHLANNVVKYVKI